MQIVEEKEDLFHDLLNNCPGKNKTWKHQGHCTSFSFPVFFSEAVPPPKKKILESSCSKGSQNGFLF